jgi:hypothetical protein
MYILSNILQRIKDQTESSDLSLAQCQALLRNVIIWKFNEQFGANLPSQNPEGKIEFDKTIAIRPLGDLIDEDLTAISSVDELLAKTTLEVAEAERVEAGGSVAVYRTCYSVYYNAIEKKLGVQDNQAKKLSFPHNNGELSIPNLMLQAWIRRTFGKVTGKHKSLGMYWMKKVEIANWIEGDDLANFLGTEEHHNLIQENKVLCQAALLDFFIQILHLHRLGWMHGDVKLDNVLISEKNGLIQLLLIDFRTFKEIGAENSKLTGTPNYLPVQVFSNHALAFQDIYGAAMLAAFWLKPALCQEFFGNIKVLLTSVHDLQDKIINLKSELASETDRNMRAELQKSYENNACLLLSRSMILADKARVTILRLLERTQQNKPAAIIGVLKNCFVEDQIVYPTMSSFLSALLQVDNDLMMYARERAALSDNAIAAQVIEKIASEVDDLLVYNKQICPPSTVAFTYAGQKVNMKSEVASNIVNEKTDNKTSWCSIL